MAALALFALDPAAVAEQPSSKRPDREQQAALGQFMTPVAIADFMAAQFDPAQMTDASLMDAGAGKGTLASAFARRWSDHALPQHKLQIEAFELDPAMIADLQSNLTALETDQRIRSTITQGDFIAHAVSRIRADDRGFTHAILNPPYKKMASASPARQMLSSVGIETVNLYSAFVALGLSLLKPGGELVAIVPRSFCNGPYYKPFRHFLLGHASIESIHLFTSRDKAFADEDVLQENVILRLKKGGKQGAVEISTSTDATFADLKKQKVLFSKVVLQDDSERFIRIPVVAGGDALASLGSYRSSLAEIDVSVSTGPVVDFRLKRHLRAMPDAGDVPLLYPGHFSTGALRWPQKESRKPNAIALNADTSRWLYQPGFYVVVRRFSSKEERRRIVASLIDPGVLPHGPIGVENHLNVFHRDRASLPEDLARGLVVYLNAKVVDDWFRQFNGHTQVNATDLRSLPYPDAERLMALGRWSKANPSATPEDIDARIGREQ